MGRCKPRDDFEIAQTTTHANSKHPNLSRRQLYSHSRIHGGADPHHAPKPPIPIFSQPTPRTDLFPTPPIEVCSAHHHHNHQPRQPALHATSGARTADPSLSKEEEGEPGANSDSNRGLPKRATGDRPLYHLWESHRLTSEGRERTTCSA
ncbi:hypothetical protein WMY93_009088 [Mugilogobius chulae]|uniref:Uncharacterized protein n=1 Tax=Mugilogobius chulae TaxID=88201 RepID=A0AAW0PAR6_9GOBI